jgi:hypothetical protein
MKHKGVVNTVVVILFTMLGLEEASLAHAAPCSLASVAGRWGYTYTGSIILPTGAVPVASVGSFKQDAAGNISGRQNRSVGGSSGVEMIAGNITVSADCTGSATINVYDDAGHLLRSAELATVYVDRARGLRLIFQSLVQVDGTNLPVVITVDARKMFADKEND